MYKNLEVSILFVIYIYSKLKISKNKNREIIIILHILNQQILQFIKIIFMKPTQIFSNIVARNVYYIFDYILSIIY